jgi:hypothetical protein
MAKMNQQQQQQRKTDDLSAALGIEQPTETRIQKPVEPITQPVSAENPVTGRPLATLRGDCRKESCRGKYRSLSVQKMTDGRRLRYLRCSSCTDTASEVVR